MVIAQNTPPNGFLDAFFDVHCPLEGARQRLLEIGIPTAFSGNRAWFVKSYKTFRRRGTGPQRIEPDDLLLISVRESLEEAIACYVFGQFLATVAMTATAVEAALAYELRSGGTDVSNLTLGNLIAAAKESGLAPEGSELLRALNELNRLRKQALHRIDMKTARRVSEELLHTAIGTGIPGAASHSVPWPLRQKARHSLELMDRITESLWNEAFHV